MLRVMAWLLAVAMLLPSAGNVFTAYAEEGKVAYSGSVEIEGKSETWWNAVNPTLSDLLGDVKPEDVIKVVFYGDPFLPGYNTNKDGGWKQPADYVKELVADDIWFNEGFALQIGVSIAPGEKATVKWDVYTANGAGKATEEPKTPAATTGKKISLTTENTDFGATNVVAPSEFEAYKNDGVKLYIEFDQEDAPWWNLAPVTQADGWPRLAGYMLNQSANENGFIQTFSKGDSNITIELSAEGVQKIIADGGLRFQVKALKVTSVTISPLKDKPKATATPKPTATPTPVPITEDTYKTVGDVLLVTEDMVKNGTVTVERAQYNSIIIPANLKADVLLKTVKADEIVVEGGADYTVTLYRCDIDKLDVTAPEVKVMTIAELNAALNAADADTEAVIAQFQEDLAAKKAAEAARVELVTTYFTTVKELNVKASAKIDANECEVDQINLAVADVEERMNVEVEEFNGAMSADLDRAEGAFAALFMLDLEDSKLSAMDVTGADSSCFIEGKASVVDAINVADAANVTLNATTGKIVVGEKATGAKVRVYSDVNEVVVKGDANSIVLPTCAEIGNAVVEGNNVKIYGYGELESAMITGTGANVAVYGTAVEGDNDSTPPAAMIAMNPYKNLVKEERPSAPNEPEGGEDNGPAHTGSVTFSDSEGWTQDTTVNSVAALLGDVAPTDVNHIVFYSTTNFEFGYNNNTQIEGETYTKQSGKNRYSIPANEIALDGWFWAIQFILTNGDGVDYTITWEVYTEAEGGNVETPSEITVALEPYELYGNTLTKIDATHLENFDGDVKFTITYSSSDGDWYNVMTSTSWDPLLKRGNYSFGGEVIELVLDAETIATAISQGGIVFQLGGCEFTQAVLSAATPDDSYVGDWNASHEIKKSSLDIESGNVEITITYRKVNGFEGDWWLQFTDTSGSWTNLANTDFVTSVGNYQSWGAFQLDGTTTEITYVMKAETYQNIASKFTLRPKGIIIENVSVSEVQ